MQQVINLLKKVNIPFLFWRQNEDDKKIEEKEKEKEEKLDNKLENELQDKKENEKQEDLKIKTRF